MCGVRGQCGGVDSLPLPLGLWDCQAVELLAEPLLAECFSGSLTPCSFLNLVYICGWVGG